jgi:hypothetical protein
VRNANQVATAKMQRPAAIAILLTVILFIVFPVYHRSIRSRSIGERDKRSCLYCM